MCIAALRLTGDRGWLPIAAVPVVAPLAGELPAPIPPGPAREPDPRYAEMSRELPDVISILRRLAPRSGLSLGGLYGGRHDEFATLLASATMTFTVGSGYSEREVNTLLIGWLAASGVMLGCDHVELRRWLVDTGLLERDGFGRRYVRATNPPSRFAEMLVALADVDMPRVVGEARAEDAARREERRARFAPKPGSPD